MSALNLFLNDFYFRNRNKGGSFESKAWVEKIIILGYKQYARFAKIELRRGKFCRKIQNLGKMYTL